jgi:two-component system sensor histidine kinase YesM
MKIYQNSLRNKLIIFLLCAIIIPISTSIILTYNYTKESVRKDYIQENTTLINQGSINILSFLNRINQTSLLIYSDLSNPNSLYKIIENENGGNELLEKEKNEIDRSLQFMSNSLKEVKQIHLYMARENMSFRIAYNLPRTLVGQTFDPDIPISADAFIESTRISHSYGFSKFIFETQEPVISFHRSILNAPTNEVLGTLSIDVKLNTIQEISEMLYTRGSEELYLLDKNGSVIYSSETKQSIAEFQIPWIEDILKQTSSVGNFEYQEADFKGIHLYQTLSTKYAEWIIVKRVPYEQLYQNARQLTLINSFVVLLFLIIAVIATLVISFRFTAPIKKLLRYINKIEAGQLDAQMEINRTDEIGILSRRFHQLMQRLNQLIMREYRLEIANKTNELKALQAQVNPHFMNNALQSIGTLALQKNEKKIYTLIASLGKMMRYQMNTNDIFVPLSTEIDYVKSYLALQSQRFEEKLQFQIEIEEESKSIQVPKMILQPIVENYFKHGFKSQNNEGEIRITCSRITEYLEISIEDNGTGMESSQLHILQSQLERSQGWNEGQTTIGLINVLSRLRLYYNETAHIRLEERQPQGLKVTLLIPLVKGEDHV